MYRMSRQGRVKMGQIFNPDKEIVNNSLDPGLGLDGAIAACYRAVAAREAPLLALHYRRLFARAYRHEGIEITAPAWRTRWPDSHQAPISWRETKAMGVAAMERIHPVLGARAEALVARGRAVPVAPGGARTEPCAFGPPWVSCAFDGGSEAAVTLAHELGHATQMWRGGSASSLPAPVVSAAELAAHVAERAFHDVYAARAAPMPALSRVADDVLAMLVRHPARDALEQAGAPDWPQIAAAYAPGLNWAAGRAPLTARALAAPGTTLAYGVAATVALVAYARLEADICFKRAYLEWNECGPDARLEDLCAALGARADDAGLYQAGYGLAARLLAP